MKNAEKYSINSIKRYTLINRQEFEEMRKWIPKEFDIPRKYKIFEYNSVFLLSKKVFLIGETVVGYAIITDYRPLSEEESDNLARAFDVPSEILRNHDGLYINDFMIAQSQRSQGIGSWFFNKIRENYLPGVLFLLKADANSDPFWMKCGFDYADAKTKLMKMGY